MKGGARENAGRPKGVKNRDTILRERAEAEYRKRVVKLTDQLMDKQLQLAEGCTYLFKIEKDEKGKNKKPILVTEPEEIKRYLENDYDSNIDYYYITTERPNLPAIQDMFDRTYGKAPASLDLTSKGREIQDNQPLLNAIERLIKIKTNGNS